MWLAPRIARGLHRAARTVRLLLGDKESVGTNLLSAQESSVGRQIHPLRKHSGRISDNRLKTTDSVVARRFWHLPNKVKYLL